MEQVSIILIYQQKPKFGISAWITHIQSHTHTLHKKMSNFYSTPLARWYQGYWFYDYHKGYIQRSRCMENNDWCGVHVHISFMVISSIVLFMCITISSTVAMKNRNCVLLSIKNIYATSNTSLPTQHKINLYLCLSLYFSVYLFTYLYIMIYYNTCFAKYENNVRRTFTQVYKSKSQTCSLTRLPTKHRLKIV